MQLLYHTDNAVLMYAYLLRHPLICQGTVRVFGVPLPAFYDVFFLPLSQADNLPLSGNVWTANQSCAIPVNVWLGTHLQSWLDLRVWSYSSHVTLRLTDLECYIVPQNPELAELLLQNYPGVP